MIINALPDRPLRPSDLAVFEETKEIEASVALSHVWPGVIDLVILLVRGRVVMLRYEGGEWSGSVIGEEDDPARFKRVMAGMLSRSGYDLSSVGCIDQKLFEACILSGMIRF